jgi:drug/metabolite transporter (DMT)-like permease
VPLALAAVYLIWGSSTLAMRVALETMPPFLLGAMRYSAAGAILFGVLRARGHAPPTRAQWASCAKLAVLFLVIGNGSVALVGSHIPCSIVAIVGATMPLIASLVRGIGTRRTSRLEVIGLALGATGLCLLNSRGELASCGSALLILVLSPIAWAVGTVSCRRMDTPKGPMMTAAQLLTGGAMMFAMSLLFRERGVTSISIRSFGALAYLTLASSLVAFTAYGYLLREAKPAIATSHAYVTPLIALALGAGVTGTHPSTSLLLASAAILSGVVVTTVSQLRAAALTQRDKGARRSILDGLTSHGGDRLSLS